MDDPFCMEEGIIIVESERLEDEFLVDDDSLERTTNLTSMHTEDFLDDETNLSNQIIIQKMDDFMEESNFNELSVIDSNSVEEFEEFESDNRNITIISRNHDTAYDTRETVVISDLEEDEDIIDDNFTENEHFAQVEISSMEHPTEAQNISNNKPDEQFNKRPQKILPKKFSRIKSSKKSLPDYSESTLVNKKESSYVRRKPKSIQVDKNDPRVRLHFVKFMKKDGKTIKIWECGICGKEFIHQYTLSRHLPIHTNERNYECNVCGKSFKQLSTLSQHRAIHFEDRPYVCDICRKTFTRVSTLLSHKKIHTKDKSHVCPECGKSFHQRGNLKNHLFTHTNERPYKCDLCNRGFNQASNLQCHKARAHFSSSNNNSSGMSCNKFKCSLCDESFSRRSSLQQHEEFVHDIKPPLKLKNNLPLESVPDANQVLKKRKIGNTRIIQLPMSNHIQEKKMGLLIEPIDTKAMHKALAAGTMPFALLKPVKGSPVVVKVQLCSSSKHMLVPASASELKAAGKFSVTMQQDGEKVVHIKVPVVATVHQRVNEKGDFHMDIEPPSDEETENEKEQTVLQSQDNNMQHLLPAIISSSVNCSNTTLTQHFVLNSSVVKTNGIKNNLTSNEAEEIYLNVLDTSCERIEYILPSQDNSIVALNSQPESSVDLLPTAANLSSQSSEKENLENANGEIQYLRPTENFGEYEVVEPDEATHFTTSNGVVEKLKPIITENVTMDQSHLSALMDALQNAGYELATANDQDMTTHQIILNSVDDTIIVEGNQIVINEDTNEPEEITVDAGIITKE